MRRLPLIGLLVCHFGCGHDSGPPASVEPKSERPTAPTTGKVEPPKSLTEQLEQLRHAKLLVAQLVAQLDQEIEQAKEEEKKFRQATALQAKIDEALKKPTSPDIAKAFDTFRLAQARLEKKRAEMQSEFGETIERLVKEGEVRLAAGKDQRLEIPPALMHWLKSSSMSGGTSAKPGTKAKE